MQAAIPLIIGALARNTNSAEGANSLAGALDRDHDGSILDDIGGMLAGAASANGDGILRHVLGDKRETAQQAVSQKSGMDLGQVASLFTMLAPIVMGFLGKQKRENNLDAAGLAGMLTQQAVKTDEKADSGISAMVTGLLDRDGDGNVMDDIGGMIGGMFGGK